MAEPNNGKRPPVSWVVGIVGVAFVWPALAVALVWRRLKWRSAWVSLSVLLNLSFLAAIVVAILDDRTESQRAEDALQTLIEPDCVECEPELLRFCRPRIGSERARIEANTVYVAARGVQRVRIEFEEENPKAITDITAFDEFGRSWMNVNFQDRMVSFDHYPSDARATPALSFIDRDLDGIPDKKIDWDLKKGFERVGEIVWRPIKQRDD